MWLVGHRDMGRADSTLWVKTARMRGLQPCLHGALTLRNLETDFSFEEETSSWTLQEGPLCHYIITFCWFTRRPYFHPSRLPYLSWDSEECSFPSWIFRLRPQSSHLMLVCTRAGPTSQFLDTSPCSRAPASQEFWMCLAGNWSHAAQIGTWTHGLFIEITHLVSGLNEARVLDVSSQKELSERQSDREEVDLFRETHTPQTDCRPSQKARVAPGYGVVSFYRGG